MTNTFAGDIKEGIAILRKQEKLAVFKSFTEESAFDLGSVVLTVARRRNAPVVVNIRTPSRALFHAALPGSAPDNDEWVRRKSNVVLRYHQSSLLFAQLLVEKGKQINPDMGLDLMNFAGHGGSFPIRLAQAGVIAALTVSGLPQVEDHRLVIEALNAFLKVELPAY